jgi:soluble lytic murein transglycosylase
MEIDTVNRCMWHRTTTSVCVALLLLVGSTSARAGDDTRPSSDERDTPSDTTARSTPSTAPSASPAESGEATEADSETSKSTSTSPPPKQLGPSDEAAASSPRPNLELSDGPPAQVRRAVRQVVGTARATASRANGSASKTGDSSSARASGRNDTENDTEAPRETSTTSAEPTSTDETEVSTWAGGVASFVDQHRRALFDPPGETLNLEPYVSHPAWEEAMRKLVDDDCREALEKARRAIEASDHSTQLRSTPAVRYAIARIQMCAGPSTRGRRTMQQLAQGDGPVAELAARRLGDSPSAPAAQSPTLADHLLEARRHARDGDVDEAIALLDDLRASSDRTWFRYKARKAQGEILVRAGRDDQAERVFSGLYRMTHGWGVGDRVADRIEELEAERDLDIVSIGERVDRMRELVDRGDYYEAKQLSIDNADIADVSGDEIDGWSFYRRGLQAEEQRDRERAVDFFEKADERVEHPAIRSRLYFGWARALRRLDRDGRAIELYRRLCREYPTHHLCDDARFQIGRLQQYQGHHEAARRAFIDLVGLHPNSPHLADALWLGGFSTYLAGHYEAVDRPLAELAERFGEREDTAGLPLERKADYWRAMAALRRNDDTVAARRFQEVLNEGALTWYGSLAAQRLEAMGREPIVALPESELTRREIENLATLDVPDHESLRVPATYARLGLYEDAVEYLEQQTQRTSPPEGTHRLLASVRLKNDNPFQAQALMRRHLEGDPTPSYFTLREWGLAYPLDYMPLAHRYGRKYQVSPFLVQAIMQRESGFRPKVDSYAGAVGLMQLMPGTADIVSHKYLGEGWVSRSDIQDPETNVRLGTAFTRAVLEFSKRRIPLALAAYNAGPGAMRSWFERFDDRQVDAWAERITYDQTRGYVRKVMTSYVRYRALYGSSLPTVRLELPSELGSWKDIPKIFQVEKGEAVSMVSNSKSNTL